ncbi:MAG: ABC transporter permease [Dethiobacteria bacterium]|jgi:osmoprotectant transport system permease protein
MINYIASNWRLIISLTVDHIKLYIIAISLAIMLGMLLGIITAKSEKFQFLVTIANTLQTMPDLVLLAVALLAFGLGIPAALAALFVKGVLPILRNTFSGIVSIDRNIIEASRGMGMSERQILFQIELPLAAQVILTGIRVSSVMVVSTLTLSAYIGVSCLGVLIAQGVETLDTDALLTGSILTALLAILLNYLILTVNKTLTKGKN